MAPAVPGGNRARSAAAGVTPSYIWPYTAPGQRQPVTNAEGFQMLMYRPLYMFGNNGKLRSRVNYRLSPAKPPRVLRRRAKTVTITMEGAGNGATARPVDASDVVFWLNMMKAEPNSYYGYCPGCCQTTWPPTARPEP